MNHKLSLFIFVLGMAINLVLGSLAMAGPTDTKGVGGMSNLLNEAADKSGLKGTTVANATSLPVRIGVLLQYALGIIGTLAVLYGIYGGATWVTAGGDSKKVDEAKKIITNAVLGVIVLSLSYLLISLAISLGAGS